MFLSFLRTVFLYLLLIAVIRIMGKRQIGEMEPSEFVVTMMTANLATGPIEDPGSPVIYGLTAILTILGSELTLSFITMYSVKARRLLCGKPVILIENGKPIQENLKSTRVTMDELLSKLRAKQVMDITSVRYAILETDGGLSVFPSALSQPASAREAGLSPEEVCLPFTVVESGKILSENLRKAGKDPQWVMKTLKNHGASPEDTLLLQVDEQDRILFIRKEERP